VSGGLDAGDGQIGSPGLRRPTVILLIAAVVAGVISLVGVAVWRSLVSESLTDARRPTFGYIMAGISVLLAAGAAVLCVVRLFRGDRAVAKPIAVSLLCAAAVVGLAWAMTPRGKPTQLTAIDLESGQVLWRRHFNAAYLSVQDVRDVLVVAGPGNDFACGGSIHRWTIDPRSGHVLDEEENVVYTLYESTELWPESVEDPEYRFDVEDNRLIHIEDGRQKWTLPVDKPSRRLLLERDESVIYLIDEGRHALDCYSD
jgi:hypothetical protein